jgi:hypothetical protein
MLRMALTLLSTLQIGTKIKDAITRALKQAAVAAIAVVFLIAAAVFGLIAAYEALVSIYLFQPVVAAAIMAGALFVVALIVLAIASAVGQEPKKRTSTPGSALTSRDPSTLIDQGVGKAMRQVGPVPLLVGAFLAGLFVGRR